MEKRIFLYREHSDDRDAVKYVSIPTKDLACGHIFRKFGLHGACFWHSLDTSNLVDGNFDSFLTLGELQRLENANKHLNELGYNINEDSKEYKLGCYILDSVQDIVDKLMSPEHQEYIDTVIKPNEKEKMKEQHDLSDEDVEYILNQYGLEYFDNGIIGAVYVDLVEFAQDYAENCMEADNYLRQHVDYKKLGHELLMDEQNIELSDERVVTLNY